MTDDETPTEGEQPADDNAELTDSAEAVDEATIVPFVPMQISPATRAQRRQKRKGSTAPTTHNGRVTQGRPPPPPAPPPAPMRTLTKPAPRACDLHKCSAPGGATVDLNVANYTGNPEDRMTLVICKEHAGQFKDGAIVGFDWSPVYRHELSPQQQLQYPRPPTEGDAPNG